MPIERMLHCSSQQQQQQQQQQQHGEEQRDWEAVLEQTLINQTPPLGTAAHLPRTLHRVSRSTRSAARATIRHLSLARYQQGRAAAQRLAAAAGEPVTPAMAAAAAAPAIPWGLLAATPSLTSLDMSGEQLEELMGSGAAATPPPPPPAAAAAAAAAAVGQNVLAATLGRLRCLRVEYLQDAPEPAQLVQLLASTTQLTRLVLHRGLQEAHARPLLEALQTTQLPAPPAATAAATAAAAAAGASDMPAVGMLPALNQLVMEAPPTGLLPAWLDSMHPATRLTSLHLSSRRGAPEELHPLPSCTALQELAVSVLSGSGGGTLELPQGLTRLTALTKLELAAQLGGPDVDLASRVIWDLGALQHLRLSDPGSNTLDCIPASISRLPQLRVLSVQGTSLTELPRELGTWLPRLEELDVSDTYIGAVPPGLTRLTRLDASGTEVTRVTAVTHLVTLKELVLERSVLSPPLQRLTQLSALESLAVGWESEVLGAEEAGEVCVPGPLPALHTLQLSGWAPSRPEQLAGVVGAQQLTHLRLCVDDKLGPQQAIAALTQLGMLPQLQELELHSIWTDTAWFDPAPRLQQLALDEDKRGATTLVAAAPWLQQQPRLVSLALAGFDVCGALLLRLPPQLEELHLDHCWLVGQQPSALSQLSRLRKLLLNCHGRQQAPPWLSSLHRLEGLAVYGDSAGPGDGSWRGVLAQLPALSHVDVSPWQALCALRDAPHLCWACE